MKNIVLSLLVMFLMAGSLSAGPKKADDAFQKGEYFKAIELYNKALRKGSKKDNPAEIKFFIGESYRNMNRPEQAVMWYEDALRDGFMDPKLYSSYGDVLLMLGKYTEAKKNFELYSSSAFADPLIANKIKSCDFAIANKKVNPYVEITPIDAINTSGSEYGIAYFKNDLIYASTGDFFSGKDISSRTGLPYSKIYQSRYTNDTYYPGAPLRGFNMDRLSNDGTFSFDERTQQAYYTRCDQGKNDCYLYFAEFNGGAWKEKGRVKVENKKTPIGHPCLSPDGRRLYFTSTMEGGMGKADIWYMEKGYDGVWGSPINAGPQINTPGQEVFPFIVDSLLYFSSDGHVGYGGLDIYVSKVGRTGFEKAINLRPPFNTSYDDLNLIKNVYRSEGAFVTSRGGDSRNDDIFQYKGEAKSLIASGFVYEQKSNTILPNVKVVVNSIKGDQTSFVDSLRTDDKGYFYTFVESDKNYTFTAEQKPYAPAKKNLDTKGQNYSAELNKASGYDIDLYLFVALSKISGIVFEEHTGNPVPNQPVGLFVNNVLAKTAMTDMNGFYQFDSIKGKATYTVRSDKEGYDSGEKSLTLGELTDSKNYCKANGEDMDIPLGRIMLDGQAIDFGKEYNIGNIYYAYAKWDLLPASYPVLEKIVEFMNKYKGLRLQISSHTDARGSASSNLTLSEKRAGSVVNYLVSRGIEPIRLTSVGYGKSNLAIPNARSEAEHQLNRRTTFMVLGNINNQAIQMNTEQPGGAASTTIPGTTTTTTTTYPGYSGTTVPVQQPATTYTTTTPVASGTVVAPRPGATVSPASTAGATMFYVQVGANTRRLVGDANITKAEAATGNKVEERQYPDGYYRYYIAKFTTAAEAQAFVTRLKSQGVNSFVRKE